ncbi:hypothetical protein L207DRAFT_506529 [Hyaloscypha variabilis F]|uniref:Actin-like ATPase domain-containing protein n=1 Tax=Hyaloscypha variabilis (strain UAMH 11265 / GT02V1 / F) TaxID=1149755 RepID=A0A2J6S9T5_HYAVF|nr:hypothetical protein L207DRAFT_506529 [Hyaloscypha variabilis F]
MNSEHPDLEMFRHELINELEEQRFRRLTEIEDQEMIDMMVPTPYPAALSRESTATLRAMSEVDNADGWYGLNAVDDEMNIDGREETTPTIDDTLTPLIIATDFGTTFSSVAYARRGEGLLPDVKIIDDYPNEPSQYTNGHPSRQVPTESWYPNEPTLEEEFRSPSPIENYLPHRISNGNIYDAEDEDERGDHDGLNDDEKPATPPPSPPLTARSFVWGYGIQKEINEDMDHGRFNRIARSKLWLDKSEHTATVRAELDPILRRLKRKKVIKENEDVIADYLTQLFTHTKTQLTEEGVISDATPIEHVLTVPAIWTADACRKMQNAMTIAVKQANFGAADNLFLVSEPEAAASYVLLQCRKGNAITNGEAFLLLDAGGGTVDATTYRVDNEFPLRLSKELVPADGCLKGSSFLNEAFKEHLRQRLLGEEVDIETNGFTVTGIIEKAALNFEYSMKRGIDVTGKVQPQYIFIGGLRENSEKRFKDNRVVMDRSDFIQIFSPCLRDIKKLMRSQLIRAREANHDVKKVVLIGGFGTSKSLQSYLREALKEIGRSFGYRGDIRLITTKDLERSDPEVAVSYGAVLRAWSKEDGPLRITQSSYGFEIMEEFRPEVHKEHREAMRKKKFNDKLDGRVYLDGVIEWHVHKGEVVPTHKEYPLNTVYRNFASTRKRFTCDDYLWVSDSEVYSHYQTSHKKNKDAELAGTIKVDMTPLVRSGKIPLTQPEQGFVGAPHYRIEYELVMIINGRNMRFEARWPRGGEVQGSTQICIAAAFRPGTD